MNYMYLHEKAAIEKLGTLPVVEVLSNQILHFHQYSTVMSTHHNF